MAIINSLNFGKTTTNSQVTVTSVGRNIWTTDTTVPLPTNTTVSLSNTQGKVPQEFGRSIIVDDSALQKDFETLFRETTRQLMDDFLEARKNYFPNYHGMPSITTHVANFGRSTQIAWYIQVPEIYIMEKKEIDEEEGLWNS